MQAQVGNELQKSYRIQEFAAPGVIMRERSFMRPQSHHHMHHNQFSNNGKRKSMVVTNAKGKPSLEIYRPPVVVRTDTATAPAVNALTTGTSTPATDINAPVTSTSTPDAGTTTTAASAATTNKLNVHAKEFTMAKPLEIRIRSGGYGGGGLQHSRSAVLHAQVPPHFRSVMPPHAAIPAHPAHPAHAAHATHANLGPRVHFKLPQQVMVEKRKSPPASLANGGGRPLLRPQPTPGLKRSKSLTSADSLAVGMAALGLAADAGDLGAFPPEIQQCIDKALEDPNAVCSRTLMEAVGHLVGRAVESPRYALPAARRCIAVVDREHTETFLDSLLNTCQQWYHDREKLLNAMVGGGRPRLMAFLSFLLEMYCQVRRRAARHAPSAPAASRPAHLLLALICKCCEDCVRQPVPSASDTENLFFVLTYIGRDLETQLPGDLERLLTAVRDTFLNATAAPSIRRTLLQLIELHASRWQLPGCAVLYYYPSSK